MQCLLTLRWMSYDKDIDKYKCCPAVTTLSDIYSQSKCRAYKFLTLINVLLHTTGQQTSKKCHNRV